MLEINEIKLHLDQDETAIENEILKKLKIQKKDLHHYTILKKSLDARKGLHFVYQVLIDVKNEERFLCLPFVKAHIKEDLTPQKVNSDKRPIVVGYGPSGIFAAYRMMEAGLKPIVFEKGKRIQDRVQDVEHFFQTGELNPTSNVQFGEGGAGTFSDAKLTTRVKNKMITYILDVLVRHGASEDIKIDAHPHVGTDQIRIVIENITNHMIEQGVEFHFEETLEELLIEDHRITGIKTTQGIYHSDTVILATGHSAYDVAKMCYEKGIEIKSKDIAIGFRVEHPQSFIDFNQYNGVIHPKLKPSEYFLRHSSEKGVYSFCMCPGGIVTPSSGDLDGIVTNGMSYAKRDSGIANSAILVQVPKEEFGSDHPLSGFDYLHEFEKKAYAISHSYKAPAMNIKDYMNNTLSPLLFPSTYHLGTTLYNLNDFFTPSQNQCFHEAFLSFDHKIPGFIEKGIMVAPETRSSSPIRIERGMDLMSVNTKGLYPTGEGSGYGGGIISCALDGIRVADRILDDLR